MVNSISFPGLMDKVFEIDRVAFTVFGKDIMWYGVIIAFGFLLAVLYAGAHCREFNWDQDSLIDGILLALPCAVIGARAYYVIFQWDYYRQHPGEIIAIWEGGLGIYGAIIATVIAVYFFCRKRKGDILGAFDMVSISYLLAQGIGRWGNFVNAEAHGGVTGMPWGMVINGGAPVHPTFLYESLWNLLGFVLINLFYKHKRMDGQVVLFYFSWYGFGRMFIEGLRTDSLLIPGTDLRISQCVGLFCFVVGLVLFVLCFFLGGKKTPEVQVAEGEAQKTQAAREPLAEESADEQDAGMEEQEDAEDEASAPEKGE